MFKPSQYRGVCGVLKRLYPFLLFSVLSVIIQGQTLHKISPTGGPFLEILTAGTGYQTEFAIVKNHGLFVRNDDSNDKWRQIVEGKVYDLEKDNFGDVYYAGENGLYKYLQKDASWDKLINGPVFQVDCISDSIIIIDTSAAIRNRHSVFEQFPAYLISTDYGQSWKEWSGTNYSNGFTLIGIEEWDKRASFVETESDYILRFEYLNLFRTPIDSLDSWKEILFIKPWPTPRLNFIKAKTTGTVYAYSKYVDLHPMGFERGGLYKSNSSGDNWQRFTDLRDVTAASFKDGVFFAGGASGIVYKINLIEETAEEIAKFGGEITSIQFTGNAIIISTTGNIFQSFDNGNSWQNSDEGIEHPFVTGLEIIYNSNGSSRFVAACRNSGIWISDGSGSVWTCTNTEVDIVPGLLKASTGGEIIYAAGSSIFASTDKGTTWNKCPIIPAAYYGWYGRTIDFEIDPGNPYRIYLTYSDHSLDHFRGNYFYRIDYNPHTNEWAPVSLDEDWNKFGMLRHLDYDGDDLWAFSEVLPGVISEASAGLIKLNVDVDSLTVTEFVTIPGYGQADIWKVDGNIIMSLNFVPDYTKWISFDRGSTWQNIEIGDLHTYRFDDPQVIYELGNFEIIDASNLYLILPGNGVFHSVDSAETWSKLYPALIGANVFELEFSVNSLDPIFIVSDNGIYRQDKIVSVKQDPNNIVIPEEFYLEQNYPNPFNPTTTIQYYIPIPVISNERSGVRNLEDLSSSGNILTLRNDMTKVSLKVYDMLGREVAALVNEYQKPGYYEVQFNATNITSGVYFYRLSAGEYAQTRKLVLMK